ncbi:MAG: crossover junction endodeoxyribonuclease RuvC [Candidatus Kerfeldbacteria bacterium]
MPNSNLTVLGIDPGIARVGYGVVAISSGSLSLTTYGVIETQKGKAVGARLCRIQKELSLIIKRCKPDRIAIEKVFFAKNASTAMVVGEARGVILLTAEEYGIPVAEFTPSVVKQSITGYGNADKAQIQRMVKALFRLRTIPRPDDAADAIAIAVCGTAMNV